MQNETKIGLNRTGMQMAPLEGPKQAGYAREMPFQPGGPENLAMERAAYVDQADRIGSVPVPATARGMLETVVGKAARKGPEVFVDLLGQRIAFERTGTRLYDALIAKVQAAGPKQDKDMLIDLHRIRDEEAAHFRMLCEAARSAGADPTAQTPCADTAAMASMGLIQVVTDPRTTVAQSLEAALTAELTDNAGWDLLIEVAGATGHKAMAQSFDTARAEEEEHLATIRRWLRACVMSEAA